MPILKLHVEFTNGAFRDFNGPVEWTRVFPENGWLIVTQGERTVLCAPERNICYFSVTEVETDGN